jgi:hypothetical protein
MAHRRNQCSAAVNGLVGRTDGKSSTLLQFAGRLMFQRSDLRCGNGTDGQRVLRLQKALTWLMNFRPADNSRQLESSIACVTDQGESAHCLIGQNSI